MSNMPRTNKNLLKATRDWARPLMANTEENGDDVIMHQDTEQTHGQKHFIRRLAFELFCFAWICPIILLLYLNFKGWIVGAGVGCRLPGLKNACDINRQLD